MSAAPTRRALLGGAVALPVLAVAAVPAASAVIVPEITADAAAWSAALTRYDRSEADYNTAVSAFGDAEERYFALRGDTSRPTCSLPGETREGLLERRAAYMEQEERWHVQSGWHDAEARIEKTSPVHDAALAALLTTPAPDLAAALHKLELVREWRSDVRDVDHVLADLRRLAGEARA